MLRFVAEKRELTAGVCVELDKKAVGKLARPSMEETAMLQGIAILVFVVVLLVVTASQARMKKPGQTFTGLCDCICITDTMTESGLNLSAEGLYDPKGYGCLALWGKTCNVEDPATGGMRSGKLEHCEQDRNNKPGTREEINPGDSETSKPGGRGVAPEVAPRR